MRRLFMLRAFARGVREGASERPSPDKAHWSAVDETADVREQNVN